MLDELNQKVKESIAKGFVPLAANLSQCYHWGKDDEEVLIKALEDHKAAVNPVNMNEAEELHFKFGFKYGVMWGAMMGRIVDK